MAQLAYRSAQAHQYAVKRLTRHKQGRKVTNVKFHLKGVVEIVSGVLESNGIQLHAGTQK